MGFSETFLSTGLPAGRTANQLLFDVLVSPRLGSDSGAKAPLSSWPDAAHWPEVAPTWEVTVQQGANTYTFTATEVPPAGSYDEQAWSHMFPPGQMQQPYQPIPKHELPIFSYPAATVRDSVRDLHVRALVNSRNEFPTVEDLRADDVFGCLIEAADPSTQEHARDRQLSGPVPDADVECHEAFAMAEITHGIRPGSGVATYILSLTPATVNTYVATPVVMLGRKLGVVTSVALRDPNGPPIGLPFTLISDNEIHFNAPVLNTTGPKTIEIGFPDGADSATLNYILPPLPAVTSVNPISMNNFLPGGKTVTVNGTDLGGATAARLTKVGDPSTSVALDPPNAISGTVVTVFVPQSVTANLYDIRITTPVGESLPADGDHFNVFRDNGVH